MNAIPPISPAPRSNDPASSDASEPAPQAPAAGADFAKVLSDAGGKPARKLTAKHHDASGGSALPSPGNQLPPPTPPVSQVPPPAAVQPGSGGSTQKAPGTAAVSSPNATTPAPPAASTAAQPTDAAPGAPPGPDMAAALTAAALVAGAPDDDLVPATPSTPMIGSAPAAPAALVATPKPAAPSAAAVEATPPTAPGPNKSDTKSEARTAKSDPAAATASSAPAQAETSSTGDPTVQTAIAASLARDSNAPKDPASATNDPATPDTGAAPPGATGSATPPAPALAVAAAAQNGAAAAPHGNAPTAAAVAQAMFNSAEAAVQGKHRDEGPDGNSSPGISNDGSAGAAQLLSANAPTDAAPLPTFKVNAGVDTPDFGQGLADRVSMMMDSNLTSAKLQVNPASLGPIEVRIALQGGHAQVWMSSHSAVTRDALESSAPKLREMLGAQGFGQVSVDISQRSFQDRSPQPQPYEVPAVRSASTGISASPVAIRHTPSGLLDAYA